MGTKWHVRAKCWGVQPSLSALVVAHQYRVDETFLLSHAQTWPDYMGECQGLFSQRITCKRDPNRMHNSLLSLTSCLFISFNTDHATFRCAAAVSRSDTGSLDVNNRLRTGLPKRKLCRNVQPYSDIKYVGVFKFECAWGEGSCAPLCPHRTQRQICRFWCSGECTDLHHVAYVKGERCGPKICDTLTLEISEHMLKTGPESRIKSICDSDTHQLLQRSPARRRVCGCVCVLCHWPECVRG